MGSAMEYNLEQLQKVHTCNQGAPKPMSDCPGQVEI